MKTINRKNVSKLVNNFTLENLTTERACLISEGWSNIKIDVDFKRESIEEIANLIGGVKKTKDRIKFVLRNTPVSEWFASRIIFESLYNRWEYVSGQDTATEKAEIRNTLKK